MIWVPAFADLVAESGRRGIDLAFSFRKMTDGTEIGVRVGGRYEVIDGKHTGHYKDETSPPEISLMKRAVHAGWDLLNTHYPPEAGTRAD